MAILWDFFSVFPANAGMIPEGMTSARSGSCVPRECGDDPDPVTFLTDDLLCSPRMRG